MQETLKRPNTNRSESRTEPFFFKTTPKTSEKFVEICGKFGISRAEALNRAVAMWMEFVGP